MRSKTARTSGVLEPPKPRLRMGTGAMSSARERHMRMLELPMKRTWRGGGGASRSAASKAWISGSYQRGGVAEGIEGGGLGRFAAHPARTAVSEMHIDKASTRRGFMRAVYKRISCASDQKRGRDDRHGRGRAGSRLGGGLLIAGAEEGGELRGLLHVLHDGEQSGSASRFGERGLVVRGWILQRHVHDRIRRVV